MDLFKLSSQTTISSCDIKLFLAVLAVFSIYRYVVTNFILKRISNFVSTKSKTKFIHRGFDCLHYILSTIIGTSAFLQRTYFHCPFYYVDCGVFSGCTGYNLICSNFEKIYFILFASYYINDILYITTNSQIGLMIFHHFVTIGMIFSCVIVCRPVPGLSIMLLHDWGDSFLYLGKTTNYLGFKSFSNVMFILFAIAFFYLRIFGCASILKVLFTEQLEQPHHARLYLFSRILFCGLYCCHLVWGYQIIASIIKIFSGKESIRDTRSNDGSIDEKEKNIKKE